MIESVQRRFTKRIPSLKKFSYRERLVKLNLQSLERRRLQSDLIILYKIIKGELECDLVNQLHNSVSSTRGHRFRKRTLRAKTDILRFSFLGRTIGVFNSLPERIIVANSAQSFLSRLKEHNF